MCLDNQEVPVVILCGGKGSRLSEETAVRPKPMVEIGGMPMLWHIMKIYSSFGYRKFILALGYKADYIKNYFYNYRISSCDFTLNMNPSEDIVFHNEGDEIDWEITFVDTGLNTLKGGRIKRIEKYVNADRFFLTYGDGVSNINIDELLQYHLTHRKIGTLSAVRPPSRFGLIELEDDVVTSFDEKPQLKSGYINGGFFVFERKLFDYLTEDESCDFEFGPLQQVALDRELRAYRHDGFWQCMDTIREKEYLEELWNRGTADWRVW